MKPAVVVVGSLNMDFVVRVRQLPKPGETVLGHSFQMIPGGKGANQAVAAGRLGAASVSVRMVGRVGLDSFGDHLKASLSAAGVDVKDVPAIRSTPTGIATIHVDDGGQNSIVVAPGANMELAADAEAFRRVFRGARIALFQLESPVGAVHTALRVAREEGLVAILDPAPAQPLSREMLGLVDVLTPNETEAQILGESVNEVPKLLLKLGAQGCRLISAGEEALFPGFAVTATDTTAAGDIFNGALAVALAEGSPFHHACRFANAAAAISVTRLGAQSSAPGRTEVDQFLQTQQAV